MARSVEGKVRGGQIYELGGPQVLTFRECMQEMLTVIDRKRLLVPVPWWVANVQASILGLLPNPLLTKDQVVQLRASTTSCRTPPSRTTGRFRPRHPAAVDRNNPAELPLELPPAGQFQRKSPPDTGRRAARPERLWSRKTRRDLHRQAALRLRGQFLHRPRLRLGASCRSGNATA